MTRFFLRNACLFLGCWAVIYAVYQLGCTVAFEYRAECVPGKVVDVQERPFEDFIEMMQHGNLPWEGSTAYRPYVVYTLHGVQKFDSTLPDLDNRNYTNGQDVEIILDPEQTDNRHLNCAKFLWGGDLMLLALGCALLGIDHLARKRRRRKARRPAPAPERPAAAASTPRPPRREPAAPAPAPAAEAPAPDLVLTAEPPAPRKRRRKSTTGSAAKSTTRTRKATATTAADKPKTPRRRKKTQDSA